MLSIAYFVLDNVMFWEAFRWERVDMGHIYIQKFHNGKMYAGLTTNLKKRMKDYRNLKGNNDHHTNALNKYVDTMQISFARCPKYLLDTVEIFVITFFDLTNRAKGYNKTTGGRKNYRHSKDSRMQMSIAKSGEKHPFWGKTFSEVHRAKMSKSKKGEKHPMFGKHHTEESRAKMSEKHIGKTLSEETRSNISIGQTGEKNHNFGTTLSEETRTKLSIALSGEKNSKSKYICVFGKLYESASMASKALREVCDTTSQFNFISEWVRRKKHEHNVFYVSKEFYKEMKDYTECITLHMYNGWSTYHTSM
jgi:group I intron endonuclease